MLSDAVNKLSPLSILYNIRHGPDGAMDIHTLDNEIKVILVHAGCFHLDQEELTGKSKVCILYPGQSAVITGAEGGRYSLLSTTGELFNDFTFSEIFLVLNRFYTDRTGMESLDLTQEEYALLDNLFAGLYNSVSNYSLNLSERLYGIQIMLYLYKVGEKKEPALEGPVRGQRGSQIIQQIVEYIQENLESSISLDSICSTFRYSKCYVSHIFKNNTGMTITNYILNRKIILAQKYIIETDKSISEIAYQLGFSSSSHFCTAFKKIIGCSPSKYRVQVKSMR